MHLNITPGISHTRHFRAPGLAGVIARTVFLGVELKFVAIFTDFEKNARVQLTGNRSKLTTLTTAELHPIYHSHGT